MLEPYQRATGRWRGLCSFPQVLSISCPSLVFLQAQPPPNVFVFSCTFVDAVAVFLFVMPRPQPVRTLSAFVIPKGYRLSVSHLLFYISTFIIATQLWTIWRQSTPTYIPYLPSNWVFDADMHANVHTLSHEQCDSAFPKLYHGLDKAVSRRAGRKVHIQDIEIAEGRCMLRVMIYQGEVCISLHWYLPNVHSPSIAVCGQLRPA